MSAFASSAGLRRRSSSSLTWQPTHESSMCLPGTPTAAGGTAARAPAASRSSEGGVDELACHLNTPANEANVKPTM